MGKFIRCIVVFGELISRRYHCAQAAPLHRVGRGWEHGSPSRILRKLAATPMPPICNKGASLLDDLEPERSRQSELRYLNFLAVSWTGFELSLTIPKYI
jgi:hypothetical protein